VYPESLTILIKFLTPNLITTQNTKLYQQHQGRT
jgi:hypothetical protein